MVKNIQLYKCTLSAFLLAMMMSNFGVLAHNLEHQEEDSSVQQIIPQHQLRNISNAFKDPRWPHTVTPTDTELASGAGLWSLQVSVDSFRTWIDHGDIQASEVRTSKDIFKWMQATLQEYEDLVDRNKPQNHPLDRATMPGRDLPSSHSRNAPPAVER